MEIVHKFFLDTETVTITKEDLNPVIYGHNNKIHLYTTLTNTVLISFGKDGKLLGPTLSMNPLMNDDNTAQSQIYIDGVLNYIYYIDIPATYLNVFSINRSGLVDIVFHFTETVNNKELSRNTNIISIGVEPSYMPSTTDLLDPSEADILADGIQNNTNVLNNHNNAIDINTNSINIQTSKLQNLIDLLVSKGIITQIEADGL